MLKIPMKTGRILVDKYLCFMYYWDNFLVRDIEGVRMKSKDQILTKSEFESLWRVAQDARDKVILSESQLGKFD